MLRSTIKVSNNLLQGSYHPSDNLKPFESLLFYIDYIHKLQKEYWWLQQISEDPMHLDPFWEPLSPIIQLWKIPNPWQDNDFTLRSLFTVQNLPPT